MASGFLNGSWKHCLGEVRLYYLAVFTLHATTATLARINRRKWMDGF